MNHIILDEIAKLEPELKKYFKQLFQSAPQEFLNTCSIITVKKNKRFITTGEDLNKVWICLSGTVNVMEEFTTGDTYIFTRFSAPIIFGEMEALAKISTFRATLVTVTDSIFIVGSAPEYINWLKKDAQLLYKRTHDILRCFMDEGRDTRTYLLLSGIERIKLYFIQQYELTGKDEMCVLTNTRQQIADETGYSLKTVNRVIGKLKTQGLITINGHKILVNKQQYNDMLESIDEKIKH